MSDANPAAVMQCVILLLTVIDDRSRGFEPISRIEIGRQIATAEAMGQLEPMSCSLGFCAVELASKNVFKFERSPSFAKRMVSILVQFEVFYQLAHCNLLSHTARNSRCLLASTSGAISSLHEVRGSPGVGLGRA